MSIWLVCIVLQPIFSSRSILSFWTRRWQNDADYASVWQRRWLFARVKSWNPQAFTFRQQIPPDPPRKNTGILELKEKTKRPQFVSISLYTFLRPASSSNKQSWALSVFFNFFNNKKKIYWIFFIKLISLGVGFLNRLLTWKKCKKSFFIIGKFQKCRKCPALPTNQFGRFTNGGCTRVNDSFPSIYLFRGQLALFLKCRRSALAPFSQIHEDVSIF